jgi:hypothetical protein
VTKRVRFTPFLRAGLFAGALCLPGTAHGAVVPFAPPLPVSGDAQAVESVVAADVDRDGDLDLLVADAGSPGRVLLLRNQTGGGTSWSSVVVAMAGASPRSVAAADVDGDGDLDVVSASLPDDEVSWHENVGGAGASWTTHTIATDVDGAAAVAVADIDRDGDADVLAAAVDGNGAVLYFQNGGSGSAWTRRTVGTPGFGVGTVSAADLDRDGDLDVLTRHEAGGPAWYESSAGGTTWTLRLVGTHALARQAAAADIDRDGDLDVLQASNSGLTWHANGAGPVWTAHTIATAVQIGSAIPADIDGDGDIDVWALRAAGSFDSGINWYENLDGNGTAWANRTVVATQSYSTAIAVADIDGDGDPEGLSAFGFSGATVVRHPNETVHRSACFAPPLTVSANPDTPNALSSFDADRDGDTDLVTSHQSTNTLLWHENAGDAAGWTAHTVAPALNRPLSVSAADVDRDGDTDLVTDYHPTSVQIGTLWLENTSGGAAFPVHTIATLTSPYGSRIDTGDIDGDGDLDVFHSGYGHMSRWYANLAGNGTTWVLAVPPFGGNSGALADIDGDGDLDLASATASFFVPENKTSWTENVVGNGAVWSTHTISTEEIRPVVVTTGDIDGDGDVDFAQSATGVPLQWRINGGAGSSWTVQSVPGIGLLAITVDLDRDGDLDMPWAFGAGNTFGWHENRNGFGSEWLAHTLPLTSGVGTPRVIGAADLDRDGDVDLLTNPASLVWHPNQGGQYALAAENTAPGTSQQGTMVSMLRVVATHQGRAGDGALELARFGVLLEEAAGDPLTTAEANLLVESLRVYRDANGNGTFEPTDTLVTSIPTLSLAAGVQDVPFADGDANVAVAFGTPATFFLVVELTADAATQEPNRLRTTLLQLGPSASRAEHAAYDLTLVPSCPADVASGVTVAVVPVELLGFTIE